MQNVSLIKGDIFQGRSQTISVTVNCVGVMGKGIALQAKKLYPEVDEQYRYLCQKGELKLGEPILIKRLIEPWILLFPTKDHWRSPSNFSEVLKGLEFLKSVYNDLEIQSLAIPPLGCGNGGLWWDIVAPAFVESLKEFSIPIELYVPESNQFVLGDNGKLNIPNNAFEHFSPSAVCFAMALNRVNQLKPDKQIEKSLVLKMGYFINIKKFAGKKYTEQTGNSMKWSQLVALMVQNGLLQEDINGNGTRVIYKVGRALMPYWKVYQRHFQDYEEYIERLARLLVSLDVNNLEVAKEVHVFFSDLANDNVTQVSLDQLVQNFHKKNARWSSEKIRHCVNWLKKEHWLL